MINLNRVDEDQSVSNLCKDLTGVFFSENIVRVRILGKEFMERQYARVVIGDSHVAARSLVKAY